MFLTNPLLARVFKFGRPGGGPDKFWKVQQYLRLAWNFRGRKRNCYKLSVRYIYKSLTYATHYRQIKKKNLVELWDQRINAASREHGIINRDFREGLARCNIGLDRKMLSELAIYEPRTFQSLTDIARQKLLEDKIQLKSC